MDVIVHQSGHDVTVLEIIGRIDSGTAPLLGSHLKQQIDQQKVRLVLHLAGVDYMSSAGLRELVAAYKRVSERGDLRLAGVPTRVMEVLEIAGLDSVLKVFDTREEAVSSFV